MKKFAHADLLSHKKQEGKDEAYLKRSFTRRVALTALAVCAGIAVLFGRMFTLQVQRYDYYRTRAQSNRVRIKPLVPERGTIYDANGIALTENILRYQVVVNPSHVENLEQLLAQLSLILGLDSVSIEQFRSRYRRSRRYESVVLKDSIEEEAHYRLALQLYRLPGAAIEPYYERFYPYGKLCAHVLGYTNRINEKDLQSIDPDDYQGIDYIGRSGIERQYEALLRGKSGYQQVEADANGNMVRLLKEVPAQRGKDIYLSFDLKLQQFIYQVLGEHRGSCVAINPQNGEVLAMVSKPGFDTNLFTKGISQRQYKMLLDDPHGPLYDRALKGRYPPGSVIKPMMLLAGLHYQVVHEHSHVHCGGAYRLAENPNARPFHCWKRTGHGSLNGVGAVAQSCDIYFYSLGQQLGIDRMAQYCQHFAMGRLTGIDMPDEDSGIMPTRAWKEARYKTNWYIGDTINASIGQGFFTTTPLQLAYMTALIARDGKSFTPYLLKRIYDPVSMQFQSPERAEEKIIPVYESQAWQIAKNSMERVIHHHSGTGKNIAQGLRYRMAGKSGTVQVISFKTDQRISNSQLAREHQDNAMFVSYAPADAPTIALSIVVERGGGGSSTAGPMARQISDFYLLGSAAENNNGNG